jgi:hypothetical protein
MVEVQCVDWSQIYNIMMLSPVTNAKRCIIPHGCTPCPLTSTTRRIWNLYPLLTVLHCAWWIGASKLHLGDLWVGTSSIMSPCQTPRVVSSSWNPLQSSSSHQGYIPTHPTLIVVLSPSRHCSNPNQVWGMAPLWEFFSLLARDPSSANRMAFVFHCHLSMGLRFTIRGLCFSSPITS